MNTQNKKIKKGEYYLKQFQFKDITYCINEVDIQDDIYVSITIGAGFTPREIQVKEEYVLIGSAAAKVFSNYIQQRMQEKYNILLTCPVSVRSTSFVWKTTKDRYIKELQLIINELYEEEIEEPKLLTEKQATIERYKNNYKDLDFRGRMKMQEFSHHNKSFEVNQLSQDLLELDVSTIQAMRRYMFIPNNTFIFFHGKSKKNELEQLIIPTLPEYEVTYLFESKNFHFLHDQEYLKHSKGDFWSGSMKFERGAILTDLAKEYVVLNIVGAIIVKDSYMVEVDPFDASIIYDNESSEEKKDFKALITEENVLEAKKVIYQRLAKELAQKPEEYMEKVGRLYVNQIHYFECLTHLEVMDAEDILHFTEMRDYRIREGFVRYYKEDKDYVIS